MAAKSGLKSTPRYKSETWKTKERASLAERKKANSGKLCSVSGCTKKRYDLYPYCWTHSRRYRRYGHPVIKLPTQGELRAIESAIKAWLDNDHLTTKADREAFKRNWSAGQQTIRNHPSFALPFSRLQGHSGYTQKSKGLVILSHYFHRQGHSLSDAMLRYMAVRLWTEFKWRMPEGSRKGFQKERHLFMNTWSGTFVLTNSGFARTTTEDRVIAWERPWYVSENPRDNLPKPITKSVTTKKALDRWSVATTIRAIGDELRGAVEHAMGTDWVSRDHRLLQKASEALGLPHSNPSIHQHFEQY
ncbi:hypothetical protein ROTO_37160 [Roseovarius tolerans]|uniref:Uncharacterized protein n=1 Tax=Roseovarius tolerans TaxID=74031 RepID=A0A0L6CPR9_9RHOB|nr:hypothetical protein [Roseovarius tolerans]KNX39747.1 hypothetical protein ROTO_37160 [Roseovarius tolerans]